MVEFDARNSRNVLVGAPDVLAMGGVLIGKVATAATTPKDAKTPLDDALKARPAGHISADGVTKTVDREVEKEPDWNGDSVLAITAKHAVTLKFSFMESANAAVLKTVYGDDNVEIKGRTITLKERSDDLPHNSFTFEIKGGNGLKMRMFAPKAQITNIGDVKFVKNEAIKYEVELECFGDEKATKLYQFIDVPEGENKVTLPAGKNGGTFTLTVGGHKSEGIAHNADGNAVQTAVRKLPGYDQATVTGEAGGPYAFTNILDEVILDATELTD